MLAIPSPLCDPQPRYVFVGRWSIGGTALGFDRPWPIGVRDTVTRVRRIPGRLGKYAKADDGFGRCRRALTPPATHPLTLHRHGWDKYRQSSTRAVRHSWSQWWPQSYSGGTGISSAARDSERSAAESRPASHVFGQRETNHRTIVDGLPARTLPRGRLCRSPALTCWSNLRCSCL